jgi:hypothetical protein
MSGYTVLMLRDTLETWQSEFLQLLWQVGGLAFFLYLGSPQSREGDERKEAKLDAILRQLGPEGVRTIGNWTRSTHGDDGDGRSGPKLKSRRPRMDCACLGAEGRRPPLPSLH